MTSESSISLEGFL